MTAPGTRLHTPPAGARTEPLDAVPGLAALYRTAVTRSARLALRRDAAPERLPDVVHTAEAATWDAARLSAYQQLIGEPGTDEAPPGYLHLLAFPLAMKVMTRPDFPLPALGMVHVANRVEQLRTVRYGEPLGLAAWATGLRPHRRGAQVDLVSEVRSGDDVIWQGTSTYLAKGVRLDRDHDDAATPRSAEDLPDAVPTAVWALSPSTTRQYAEVSGDRNPIHLSRVAARLAGFPRQIAHGMDTAARALAALRRRPELRHGHDQDLSWYVEFASPVVLPARVGFASWREPGSAAGRDDDASPLDLIGFAIRRPRDGRVHLHGHLGSRAR